MNITGLWRSFVNWAGPILGARATLPAPPPEAGLLPADSFRMRETPSTLLAATLSGRPLPARFFGYVFSEVIEAKAEDAGEACLYSGTSLAVLERIIRDSGGFFDPAKTCFSDHIGFCYGYARTRAWRDRSPRMIVGFPRAVLDGRLVQTAYQPMISDHRGRTVQMATFYQATDPLHVSQMSTATKRTILEWLTRQRELRPGLSGYWDDKIAVFAGAFAAPDEEGE